MNRNLNDVSKQCILSYLNLVEIYILLIEVLLGVIRL